MKLNNKGMSIIEIVLSFTMVMIMVTGMLIIVVNYRNKVAVSLEKLKMDTFKNTLTQDIQNDILNLGLQEINYGGACDTDGLKNSLKICINLVFQDGTNKAFGISKISPSNRSSVENKYLFYDGLKYKLHDPLPDQVPEGRNYLDLQSIIVDDKAILKMDSAVLEDGTNVALYSIDVDISHVEFSQDFGIHIVASTDDISL